MEFEGDEEEEEVEMDEDDDDEDEDDEEDEEDEEEGEAEGEVRYCHSWSSKFFADDGSRPFPLSKSTPLRSWDVAHAESALTMHPRRRTSALAWVPRTTVWIRVNTCLLRAASVG